MKRFGIILFIIILFIKLTDMKCILFILLLAFSGWAEDLPPAAQILAAARAQLPSHPVHMSGTLKERAPNGFVKKTVDVEMTLNWGAEPPSAKYRINDKKSHTDQTLEIKWLPGGSVFQRLETNDANGVTKTPVSNIDPHTEISDLGITWADLSFSFLWNENAQTVRTGKKLGKECFVISVPRPESQSLLIWIEQKTGRILGAEEQNTNGTRVKIIKVVSVKEFEGLWMVKDLDIIRSGQGGRTSLRVDQLDMISGK